MKQLILGIFILTFMGCGKGGAEGGDHTQISDIIEGVIDVSQGDPKDATSVDVEEDILCNPYTQDPPCPIDQTCIFDENDQIACVEKGSVPVGGECGPNDLCEIGVCMDLGGTGARCYKFCKIQVHCGPGLQCLGIQGKPWKVCELPPDAFKDIQCSLLKQDCKSPKQGCYYTGVTKTPICVTAGNADKGQACEKPEDCKKGLVCYNKICHLLCDKNGGEPSCPENESCKHLYWGAENAGVCDE